MLDALKYLFFAVMVLLPFSFYYLISLRPIIGQKDLQLFLKYFFAITVAGFLIQNLYIYAGVFALIIIGLRTKRHDLIPLFIILMAAMPFEGRLIRNVGPVQSLVHFSHYVMVVMLLLMPVFFTHARSRSGPTGRRVQQCALIFMALIFIAEGRDTTATDALRRTFDLFMDMAPLFAILWIGPKLVDIARIQNAYILLVLLLAPLALFETVQTWHLYGEIERSFSGDVSNYSFRGGLLRATGPVSGGPLVLGCVLLPGLMFLLSQHHARLSSRRFLSLMGIIGMGIMATLSRGPLLAAAFGVVTYIALSPRAGRNLVRTLVIGMIGVSVLMITPIGDKLIDYLPFVGSADSQNVDHRGNVIRTGIQVVMQHPIWGSANYINLPAFQKLIQGQGIVDILNFFLRVALETGLVGLFFFAYPLVLVSWRLWRIIRAKQTPPHIQRMARSILAAFAANFLLINTLSGVMLVPVIYFLLLGIGAGFIDALAREAIQTVAPNTTPTPANKNQYNSAFERH